MKRCKMKSTK